MAMATQQKTLVQQKVAVQVKLMMENESLWAALLIFLGALFLLNTFPFYPIYLTFILAIVCGGVAYKVPWAGTGLSMVVTFPAVAYQSPLFAWVFAILLSGTCTFTFCVSWNSPWFVFWMVYHSWNACSFISFRI